VLDLCVGATHSCALISDGKVFCWGDNEEHQLAASEEPQWESPRPVALPAAAQIACGESETCVRTEAGAVHCLGVLAQPEQLPLPAAAQELALHRRGGCARLADARVVCWDRPTLPAIGTVGGIPTPAARRTLWELKDAAGASKLVPTPSLSEALCVEREGATRCYGQLSDHERTAPLPRAPDATPSSTLLAAAPPGATRVAYGFDHACALDQKSAWCWGEASRGQLGNGEHYLHENPVRVPALTEVSLLDASTRQACALSHDKLFCWGSSVTPQGPSRLDFAPRELPVPGPVLQLRAAMRGYPGTSREQRNVPTFVRTAGGTWELLASWQKAKAEGPGPIARLVSKLKASSPDQACGVQSDGALICAQRERFGESGTSMKQRLTFSGPEAFAEASSLFGVGGVDHVCGRTQTGHVACFAADGRAEARVDSAELDALQDITALSAQSYGQTGLICARAAQGAVFCWGDGRYGQLGPKPTNNAFAPQRIRELPPIAQVAAGGPYVCARTSTSELYCWGSNRQGNVPDGAKGSHETPVRVQLAL
jgi:alpha-tubulin suppressor-like RCC1 family protein